jgi:hypothetical protein
LTVVGEPALKVRMNCLSCSIRNYHRSRPKVNKLSLFVDYVELVGLGINLDRVLSFLNFGANHSVLHQLDGKRLALRVKYSHLLCALADVAQHVVAHEVQKVAHVAQRHN